MGRGLRIVADAVAACALFLVLSRAALAWGGNLLPIPLWLATASTVGLALSVDRWRWPAILFGGAVVGNVVSALWLFDETLRSLLTPSLSVLAESCLATWGLDRVISASGIRRTRASLDVLLVSLAAAAVGATIATLETVSPVIGDRAEAWVLWVLGDLIGLLVVVPLVVAYRAPLLTPPHARPVREGFIASGLLLATVAISFSIEAPVLYSVVPALMWLSIRFGPWLAAPAVLVTVVLATLLSGRGNGPFASNGVDAVIQVQGFNLAVAVAALIGSAHAVRAWDDQQQLAAVLRALPDAVALKDEEDHLLSLWVPPHLQHLVAELVVKDQDHSPNPIDHITPGLIEPAGPLEVLDHSFEVRVATTNDGKKLQLFRDVTESFAANRELRAVREQIEVAEVRERTRLGRELHDGPIQSLAAAGYRLDVLIAPTSELQNEILEISGLIRDSVHELRATTAKLIPSDFTDDGLLDALNEVAHRMMSATETVIDLRTHRSPTLTTEQAEILYLVGREALANVAFHAEAGSVVICLDETDDSIALEIADDGVGMARRGQDESPHFGLRLMRQRVEEANGRLDVETNVNGGVTIRARIPQGSERDAED